MGRTSSHGGTAKLALLAALAAATLALPAPASAAVRVLEADLLEAAVVARINSVRASTGLRKLSLTPELATAGGTHASSMAKRGFFSHSWANGASYGTWIRWFYPGPGVSSWQAGENLYWATGTTAHRVVAAWMRSPGHRANILRPGWRQIGVGAVRASNPGGTYAGLSNVVIVAAEFGARS